MHLPFYQYQLNRTHAFQEFHEGLLRERLKRAKTSRNRTDLQSTYKVGDDVDIHLTPPRKDLDGWRGPARIVDVGSEGMITVRWQSDYKDVPLARVRPHIPLIGGRIKESAYFRIYQIEQTDQDLLYYDPGCQTLFMMANNLSPSTVMTHLASSRNNSDAINYTREYHRDGGHTFRLGHEVARRLNIPNFTGIVLFKGKQHLPPHANIRHVHLVVFPHNKPLEYQT